MRKFTPAGYLRVDAAINLVLQHLTPGLTEQQMDEIKGEEAKEKLYAAIDFLRGILFEQRATAFYEDSYRTGFAEIPHGFWISDDADAAIVSGKYAPFGRSRTPFEERPEGTIFFRTREIENSFKDETVAAATEPVVRSGRPRIQPKAAAAYKSAYPHGHEVIGHTLKEVRGAVERKIGKKISTTTLTRAIKSLSQNDAK